MNKEIFKENIEHLTGETKQNKIADILNVSESKVSKWFSGSVLPTLDDLLNISHKYNCSIDWLIGNELKKDTISVYDVCKSIVNLDSALYLTINIDSVKELHSMIDRKNDEVISTSLEEYCAKISFCNSLESIKESVLDTDGYSKDDFLSIHGDSIIHEHMSINNFLERYVKLKEAYINGYIDNDSFIHMTNHFLEDLSKSPIDYWYEYTNQGDELPFE